MLKVEDLLGKIWQGDCLAMMKQLPDKCVDLVLTDPPYGIDAEKVQESNSKSCRVSNGGKWKKYDVIGWDKTPPSEEYFNEMIRISKRQIIWGGNYFRFLPMGGWFVWNKVQRNYMTDGEMAWTDRVGSPKIFDMSRADAYINRKMDKQHPTQKPVELFLWCVDKISEANIIFDPFMGSGTTAVACERLGRKWFGCELEPKYVEIANKRIEAERAQLKLF